MEELKQKILVIDDDETLCLVIGEELEQENYSVTCSFCGRDGLDKLKIDNYSLVILDYNMPEMDGYEVLMNIKITYPSLPVIIITGDTGTEMAKKFLEIGANDLVNKPFEFDYLLGRVQKFILNI